MENKANFGVGFDGLLTLLFITLKLTGCIEWSWLWVLSPLWIPFVIVLLVILAVGSVNYLKGGNDD